MLAQKKTNTNIGIGGGFVLQLIGNGITTQFGAVGYLVVLAGIVMWLWGCWNYAQGKGYPGFLGLLGIFSCIGLVILAVLPDKNK